MVEFIAVVKGLVLVAICYRFITHIAMVIVHVQIVVYIFPIVPDFLVLYLQRMQLFICLMDQPFIWKVYQVVKMQALFVEEIAGEKLLIFSLILHFYFTYFFSGF